MVRETYFVTPKGELHETNVGTQMNAFEIRASQEEKMEMERVIEKLRSQKYVQQNDFFSLNHYDESEVDRHRDWTDEAIYELYKMIYRLGTSHTKQQIDQMGVLSALNHNTRN
ncbi:hypothetical protein [Anaerobacillus sp. 1_MG-2023]|uniref:hypothetical protein n=1 Tax=Bacillales TaxID=1385 RepID=UPI0026E20EB8|nr:hypothetical protein [Anaerobacillus sp. 1_MG-2023]MDO6658023.1 hypothetical protein [Anaerobacillus sp. 1_MG-2023]